MNELIPFKFENRNVRVVMLDGVEWWVARDAAIALGYNKPTRAFHLHCKGAPKWRTLETEGGPQKMRIVNEGDLFRLIANCTLPAGQRFEKWLFETVLPQIRKTGSYGTIEKRFEALEMLVARLSEENERLRRSKTRPTPQDEREIRELRQRGYSKAQICRELYRGISCVNRILEKYTDAIGQLGLFTGDDEDEALIAASRGKGGAA